MEYYFNEFPASTYGAKRFIGTLYVKNGMKDNVHKLQLSVNFVFGAIGRSLPIHECDES